MTTATQTNYDRMAPCTVWALRKEDACEDTTYDLILAESDVPPFQYTLRSRVADGNHIVELATISLTEADNWRPVTGDELAFIKPWFDGAVTNEIALRQRVKSVLAGVKVTA